LVSHIISLLDGYITNTPVKMCPKNGTCGQVVCKIVYLWDTIHCSFIGDRFETWCVTGIWRLLPCHHGIPRSQVADKGTASNMKGSFWFMLIMLIHCVEAYILLCNTVVAIS